MTIIKKKRKRYYTLIFILSFVLLNIPSFYYIPFIKADDPDPEAYILWEAPVNTFGLRWKLEPNWPYLKSLFLDHIDWLLEYKRYSYSDWTNGMDYLQINRSWNTDGFWKFDLFLQVPVDIYSARFTLAVDRPVLQYVEHDGFEVWLNYSANETEVYPMFFNWSDLANIQDIIFTKGIQDNRFWFRFRKDNIPAGNYSFDPTFGTTTTSTAPLTLFHHLHGINVTAPEDGYAESITAYLKNSGSYNTLHMKYMLYDENLNLLANTTVGTVISNSWDWYELEFNEPYVWLNEGQEYYLTMDSECWENWYTASAYSGSNTNGWYWPYLEGEYEGSWTDVTPDPLDYTMFSFSPFTFSIYCTYEEDEDAPPTIENRIPLDNSTQLNNTLLSAYFYEDNEDDMTIEWYYRINNTPTYTDRNVTVRPVREGESLDWNTKSLHIPANHWGSVDESSPNGDTDYVYTPTGQAQPNAKITLVDRTNFRRSPFYGLTLSYIETQYFWDNDRWGDNLTGLSVQNFQIGCNGFILTAPLTFWGGDDVFPVTEIDFPFEYIVNNITVFNNAKYLKPTGRTWVGRVTQIYAIVNYTEISYPPFILLATDTDVETGTYSHWLNLSYGETVEWYIVVTDGRNINISKVWTYTTVEVIDQDYGDFLLYVLLLIPILFCFFYESKRTKKYKSQ